MRKKLVATVVNLLLVFTLIFAHSYTVWAEDGEPEIVANENASDESSGQENVSDVPQEAPSEGVAGETPALGGNGDSIIIVLGTTEDPEPYHQDEEDPSIVDAEKYSGYVDEYDSELCWAATAANMLWMGGYADSCINPATGELFQSEDEVFDYFRNTFTDAGGFAEAGIEYFLFDYYKYQGMNDVSQLKEDGYEGGKYPELINKPIVWEINCDPTMETDFIAEYESYVDQYGGGVGGLGVYWWKIDSEEYTGGHAITLIQFEQDEDGNYIGVWFVDSGSDYVYDPNRTPTGPEKDDPDERAELAAEQPNKMHYYNLVIRDVDDGLYYVIDGYGSTNYYAVLQMITFLRQFDPALLIPDGPGGKSEDATCVTNEAFANINNLMINANVELLSLTGNIYDPTKDTGYSLFVRRPAGMLMNVYVDDNRLSEGGQQFKVYSAPSGIFSLTIGTETMRSLESGEHTITLDFGNDSKVQTVVTVK